MRNSFQKADSQLKKTASTNYKRYSQHDFHTTHINRLLITQSSAISNINIRSLKTKLPQISPYNKLSASYSSHNRINIIADSVGELGSEVHQLNLELEETKLVLLKHKENIDDKYDKEKSILGNKILNLSEMIKYKCLEDKKRSEKINSDYELIQENSRFLRERIEIAKTKMKNIEDLMGLYTGQDKHFA